MEYDKIMAGENLENIVNRLSGCCAMLDMVHANMSGDGLCVEALYGCCESLKGICRDLDADIASAEDFIPVPEVAV